MRNLRISTERNRYKSKVKIKSKNKYKSTEMKKLYTLALVLLTQLVAFAADGDMRGFACCTNWYFQGGVVTLSPTSSSMSLKYTYEDDYTLGFAVGCYDNFGHVVYDGNDNFLVFTSATNVNTVNISTGKIVDSGTTTCSLQPTALTYDHKTKLVYGFFKRSDSSQFIYGSFDPSAKPFTVNEIATTATSFIAMAASPDDLIYGISYEGMLVAVEKESGDMMEIGATGKAYSSTHVDCATFDWNTGKMYFFNAYDDPNSGGGRLYTINTSTGSATKLFDYPAYKMLSGIDFAYTPSATVSMPPSVVNNLKATYTGSSLTGTVSFTAPSTLADGSSASGDLTYTIKVDDVEVTTGQTTCGGKVNSSVTVANSGLHTFTATVSNEYGECEPTTIETWVGYDKPMPVSNIDAHYNAGVMTVTWTAPTAGVNGKYFNATSLKYNIYRNETTLVGENVTTCSLTDEIGEPQSPTPYTYTIYAVQGDQTSDGTTSRIVYAGAYSVPFISQFDNEEDGLGDFTVINGGDPDFTWRWKDNLAEMPTYGHQAADDWLITPPIHLETGKEYYFRFDAKCGGNGANAAELMDVAYGTETTAEAMTNVLLTTTLVNHNSFKSYGFPVTVAKDGDYCFGIHCTSEIHYDLQVDNIVVRLNSDYGVPAAVSDLVVTADYDGKLQANVKFTVPSLDVYGDPIDGVTDVKIYRDDAVIDNLGAKAAGEQIDYLDTTVPEAGYHRYIVATVNEKGQSAFTQSKCYVGVNIPKSVTNIIVQETATWGEVSLSWTAPTSDIDGNPIKPENITYDIYNEAGSPVADDVAGTSYTYVAVAPGEPQKYIGYKIVAKTAGGEADAVSTGMLPVGEPATTPYFESFADGSITQTIAVGCSQGAGGIQVMSENTEGVTICSQDEDGGFLCIEGTPSVDASNLDVIDIYSGKIAISGTNPGFSFYYLGQGLGSSNSIRVYVEEWGVGDSFTEITTEALTTNISNTWVRVQLPLLSYAGKIIRFKVQVNNVIDRYTYLDRFCIDEMQAHDMEIYSFEMPSKARAGEGVTAKMIVQNIGYETATDWKVVLECDGKDVYEQNGIELETGSPCIVYLYDVPSVLKEGNNTYKARVDYALDQDNINNDTESVSVEIVMPEWPSVQGINGEKQGSDFVVTWGEPSNADCTTITDDFEDYYPWEKEAIGDWYLYDYDQLKIVGIVNWSMPVSGTPCSFFVCSDPDGKYAHSGTQSLAAFGSSRGQTEDWLISPVLSGEAQTISFWERNHSYIYSNIAYCVYVSKTGKSPSNFLEAVSPVTYASTSWTQHSYELPEGSLYFAIVAQQDLWHAGLFIDDITYTPGVHSTYDLQGYRIYRDGEYLADIDKAVLTYTDTNVVDTNASHTYVVTAVYSKGESIPSSPVGFGEDGIESISGNVNGMQIYDLSGRRLNNLSKGIVIINGQKVVK